MPIDTMLKFGVAIKSREVDEVYHGERTGRRMWYTESVFWDDFGSVLGRGYTERESQLDWVRRAEWELAGRQQKK